MKRSFAIISIFLLSLSPLFAYLDPGSGSMMLQLILGGLAGLAVIIKLYWRKFLAKVTGKSYDDEAQGKPVEEDTGDNTSAGKK